MAARHDLDLPGGQILRGLYLPAPLQPGDHVHVHGEAYEVEQALTIIDEPGGTLVRARLKPTKPRPQQQ
jgi:hypothetical protein